MTEIRYTEIAKVPSIKEESVMPCVDFNTFIQKLPADCKDFFEEDCCRFTLPKKIHTCPACGSQHTCVDKYRDQELKGIADTKLRYIYHARRYRCID